MEALHDPGGGGSSRPDKTSVRKELSYADRLKTNIKYDQRLKRNVLEVVIEKSDKEDVLNLDQNSISRLLTYFVEWRIFRYQGEYGQQI